MPASAFLFFGRVFRWSKITVFLEKQPKSDSLLGMLVMFMSVWTFFIYGPLFFVAFILAIVAMAQGRIAGGLVLLLSCLIVPGITFLVLSASRTDKFIKDHPVPNQQSSQFGR